MSSLATIHTGKKALGLDDETYRSMLHRISGKQSAKDLNENERIKVIEEMRRQGFKKASKPTRKPLEGKYAKKLQALWIAGWNLGIVKDRNDKALLAFAKRQTGIDHVRFIRDGDDAYRVIEALKRWLSRDGGVDWSVEKDMPFFEKHHGYKISYAQYQKLRSDATKLWEPFWNEINIIIGDVQPNDISDQQWQIIMNVFGKRIRENKNNV